MGTWARLRVLRTRGLFPPQVGPVPGVSLDWSRAGGCVCSGAGAREEAVRGHEAPGAHGSQGFAPHTLTLLHAWPLAVHRNVTESSPACVPGEQVLMAPLPPEAPFARAQVGGLLCTFCSAARVPTGLGPVLVLSLGGGDPCSRGGKNQKWGMPRNVSLTA